ncbi:hypothetical protein G6F56_011976 [Rhizopus delemar]|nr:hypothetical protein G6F56_011976 [Rhizopus delemar]
MCRTARAGRGGKAISIVAEKDIELIQNIEGQTNKTMEKYEVNENEVLDILTDVTAAKRMASMQLHDKGFGEKTHIRKKKKTAM